MVSKFSEIVRRDQNQFSLRKYLKQVLGQSQKEVQALIEGGSVFIDQRKETFGSKKVKTGQRVHFSITQSNNTKSNQLQKPKEVEIIWENEELLAANKPAGLPSQRTKDKKRYSMEHWASERDGSPLFLTHRLDRDTSGVLLFAKTKKMEAICFDWFKHRKVQKTYHAVCHGKAKTTLKGKWVHHLGQDNKRGGRSCFKVVRSGGLRAETNYRTITSIPNYSFWELKPHTGRTHQLRVQCAAEGFPIVGDELYDPKFRQREATPHHFLHARELLLPDLDPIQAEYPKTWIKTWSFLK